MSSTKRKKGIKKSKKKKKRILLKLIVLLIICLILYNIFIEQNGKIQKKFTMYLASPTTTVELFKLEEKKENEKKTTKVLKKEKDVPRGTKITTTNQFLEYQNNKYQKITLNQEEFYINKQNLVTSKNKVAQEKEIYIRTSTSILENMEESKIIGYAKKGEKYPVVSYDSVDKDGNISIYQIKIGDQIGYIYGKYTTFTEEEAIENYQKEKYDPIHSKIKNTYDGGEAIKLDFYPNPKPNFKENQMPDAVYALYLNCNSNTIDHIDSYINFAKTTKINAFVVDIKDNEAPAYPAKTFEKLSPTNYQHAANTYESYKNAITKLKQAGFYVIGRITVFKDSYYVQDNPQTAILNKNTNAPYLHNGSYWPSAYNRDVWYYNVSLAKESVQEFGFNEINFDYVRFPDRMNSISNIIDLKNSYQEDKAEAIERFVQYATDALHELNTYVSIDVFGETTNESYTTAYGQYWPSISNIADVISGMPYPDHFSSGYYGLKKPWNEPYKLMNYWATYAYDRQQECPTPAKVRTWIQAYDVMKYVDTSGITYGAKELEEEIRGLYDAKIQDGYITWLSNSSLEKYQTQQQAFQIDYRKEYQS